MSENTPHPGRLPIMDILAQVAPLRAEAAVLPGVVVAGQVSLDIFPDLSTVPDGKFLQLFKPGHLLNTGPMTFATGGATSNTGLALHRLGIPTQIMAKIGDDPFGKILLELVRRAGPELEQGITVAGTAATSYTLIISPPGVDRIFLNFPGANDTFGVEDIDYDLLETVALFHFGYPPLLSRFYQHHGRELAELFNRAKRTGVTTSLDLSMPDPAAPAGQADWVAILSAALPFVDIFMPSVEELLFMLRRKTYDVLQENSGGEGMLKLVTPELLHSLSAQMLEMGVKIAGLKLGERGLYLRTAAEKVLVTAGRGRPANPAAWADQTLWAPAFDVEVAGATGAGDSAIAGFLGGLLRGLDPRQVLSMAAAVGACNVEAADALSGLLSWEATQARVAAGWECRPLELGPAGWHWDDQTGVWVLSGI